jgi:hypothetical protein
VCCIYPSLIRSQPPNPQPHPQQNTPPPIGHQPSRDSSPSRDMGRSTSSVGNPGFPGAARLLRQAHVSSLLPLKTWGSAAARRRGWLWNPPLSKGYRHLISTIPRPPSITRPSLRLGSKSEAVRCPRTLARVLCQGLRTLLNGPRTSTRSSRADLRSLRRMGFRRGASGNSGNFAKAIS